MTPRVFTPTRRRGMEFLDDPGIPDALRLRSTADVALSNALFGGRRSVVREVLRAVNDGASRSMTVLDVGTGLGDIPRAARAALEGRGINVTVAGVECAETLARATAKAGVPAIRANALALPFRSHSVDIVFCSQLLHHFDRRESIVILREMARVARRCVIVSDIRRSWLAAAGIWLASFLLRFHPVSRHDGVTSVMRGFTVDELSLLVGEALGGAAQVRRHPGFRVTASWRVAWAP